MGNLKLYKIKKNNMSDFYKKILDNNKKWVEDKLKINPNFFL